LIAAGRRSVRYCVRIQFLPTPRAFDAPVREGFAITFGTEKLDWCGYPKVKKIEDMFIRFDRMYERDTHATG